MPYFSLNIILVLLAVLLVSAVLVARLIPVLTARNQVDTPNHRSLHAGAVPRGGGLIIVLMMVLAFVGSALTSATPIFYSALAVLMFAWSVLGWGDDVYDFSPRFRFVVQFGLSIIAVLALGWVNQIALSVEYAVPLAWLGVPVTVVGMVWLANLYNFMDGMDGLAASQAIVAGSTLAFWFGVQGSNELAVVCAIVAAASYGFLWHNWRPASIFMGDVGSVSLGAFFALMLIIGANRFDISILTGVVLLLTFVGDATITFALRAIRGERLSEAHRSHFYQKLAEYGYSHRRIVIAYIVYMLLCALAATLMLYQPDLTLSLFVVMVTLTLVLAIGIELHTRERSKTAPQSMSQLGTKSGRKLTGE